MKEDFSKIAAQGLYAFVANIYKKAYNQGARDVLKALAKNGEVQKAYKNMQCDCFRDLAGFQYGSGYCPKGCCLRPRNCTECIDETDFYDALVEMGLE